MTQIPATHRKVGFAGLVVVCVALAACRGGSSAHRCPDLPPASGPAAVLIAYAEALEEGDLATAHGLVDPAQAGSLASFEARYADPAVRKARAAEIRASLEEVRIAAPGVAAVERDGWRVVDGSPAEARQTLEAFLSAAEVGDFDAAYRLLSGKWRSAYTPERLRQDFEAESQARDRLARARQALLVPPQFRGGEVAFPIGEGKAVRLVREGDAFRVAALE